MLYWRQFRRLDVMKADHIQPLSVTVRIEASTPRTGVLSVVCQNEAFYFAMQRTAIELLRDQIDAALERAPLRAPRQ
jgi:hypothetical protein